MLADVPPPAKIRLDQDCWRGSKQNVTTASEQGLFFQAGQHEKSYATIKTEQKVKFLWILNEPLQEPKNRAHFSENEYKKSYVIIKLNKKWM